MWSLNHLTNRKSQDLSSSQFVYTTYSTFDYIYHTVHLYYLFILYLEACLYLLTAFIQFPLHPAPTSGNHRSYPFSMSLFVCLFLEVQLTYTIVSVCVILIQNFCTSPNEHRSSHILTTELDLVGTDRQTVVRNHKLVCVHVKRWKNIDQNIGNWVLLPSLSLHTERPQQDSGSFIKKRERERERERISSVIMRLWRNNGGEKEILGKVEIFCSDCIFIIFRKIHSSCLMNPFWKLFSIIFEWFTYNRKSFKAHNDLDTFVKNMRPSSGLPFL